METTQKQKTASQNSVETRTQQLINSNNSKLFVVVVITALLTTVIVGSVVYFRQKSMNEQKINSLKQRISSLEEKETSALREVELTPQPQLSPSDSTENWETYQNEDVTFKYPPHWIEKPILIRGSGYTQEFKDQGGKFSLSFLSNGNYNQMTGSPYSSLDEYINMPYKVEVVTVDGQEGRRPLPRAGSENINSVAFFSKDSKFLYTLELQTGSTAFGDTPSDASVTDIQEGQKLFNQVISTFKFAN